MRGKKSRRLRKIAVAEYSPVDSTSGHEEGKSQFWGTQWKRRHNQLKRQLSRSN